MITRRELCLIALAGLVRLKPDTTYGFASSTINGVHLGVQTYSFRDIPRTPGSADAVDVVIKAMTEAGLTECELFAAQLEPAQPQFGRGQPPSPEQVKAPEELRRWRVETPIAHFRDVKKKFDAAGITVHAFCWNMNNSFTDAEIDRGFEIGKALGAKVLTSSTTLDVAKRIDPIADKHQMPIGMHGHSNLTDPNEFAAPESFATAMKMSKFFKINLDIGHFTAANFDPVAYIKEHHADITNLHVKDRKKNQGDNTVWGQGETPIKEVLQLLKKERWPIPAYIEYEYRGQGTPTAEVKKCFEYAKQALAERPRPRRG